MPDPAGRTAQDARALPRGDEPGASVARDSSGALVSPPVPAPPALARGRNAGRSSIPRDLADLNQGWELLNAGQAAEALGRFQQARGSRDAMAAREATLGAAYAHWRLGREAQAEALFKSLVEADFRVPEVLPNLLFLLRKNGGPKAVEPYLHRLPEADRARWR